MAVEIALITGCATGIGRALAEELHTRKGSNGGTAFKVYATDRSLEALADLGVKGISTAQLDVTDESSIKTAVDEILRTEGRIDLLVCNAGMVAGGWLVEAPIRDLRRMFDVNVFGAFRVVQAVAPSMMDRRKGKIATLCSVASYVCQAFNGGYSLIPCYPEVVRAEECGLQGSKAALAIMTEALRIEVEPFGVAVTSVVPGWVKSQIFTHAATSYDMHERPDGLYHCLMGRMRAKRDHLEKQGVTTQRAAKDIADGLCKTTPPRFVYTGTWLIYALVGGFIQMWLWPGLIASIIQRKLHLDQPGKLGRAVSGSPGNEITSPPKDERSELKHAKST